MKTEIEWIPIKFRPLTDEEKELFESGFVIDNAFDCPLPDDDEEVLVSTIFGTVMFDTFCRDSDYGCYFEDYDYDQILAWAHKPNPYKEAIKECDT